MSKETERESEERLEGLFKRLDRKGNGRIDIHDLTGALKEFNLSVQYAEVKITFHFARRRKTTKRFNCGQSTVFCCSYFSFSLSQNNKKFLKRSDQDKSGDVGLNEFINYVREHEKNLQLQFSELDKNKDGKVDLDELILAFKELGFDIDRKEAMKLLERWELFFISKQFLFRFINFFFHFRQRRFYFATRNVLKIEWKRGDFIQSIVLCFEFSCFVLFFTEKSWMLFQFCSNQKMHFTLFFVWLHNHENRSNKKNDIHLYSIHVIVLYLR